MGEGSAVVDAPVLCPGGAADAERAGLVSLAEVIPDAILDIRYYTAFNFVGERIDGYEAPAAYLTRAAADALRCVSDDLRAAGYRIKIFDAYRPTSAVAHFVRWAEDLDAVGMKPYFYPGVDKADLFAKGYIAQKSSRADAYLPHSGIASLDPQDRSRKVRVLHILQIQGPAFDTKTRLLWEREEQRWEKVLFFATAQATKKKFEFVRGFPVRGEQRSHKDDACRFFSKNNSEFLKKRFDFSLMVVCVQQDRIQRKFLLLVDKILLQERGSFDLEVRDVRSCEVRGKSEYGKVESAVH